MKVLNEKNIPEGYPCKHKGCLSHVSHPCEVCGRTVGKGESISFFKYMKDKEILKTLK
jgi:hypothetical protein